MKPYVSPESQRLKEALASLSEKIEIRQDLERILDLTEEKLQTQLVQEVSKGQHGDHTADVDAARENLVQFHENRWQKERKLLEEIDQNR